MRKKYCIFNNNLKIGAIEMIQECNNFSFCEYIIQTIKDTLYLECFFDKEDMLKKIIIKKSEKKEYVIINSNVDIFDKGSYYITVSNNVNVLIFEFFLKKGNFFKKNVFLDYKTHELYTIDFLYYNEDSIHVLYPFNWFFQYDQDGYLEKARSQNGDYYIIKES